MASVAEVLSERFLIDLVWIDKMTLSLKSPDGTARGSEQRLVLKVMAIEKNDKPNLPLRETTYELEFNGVTGFRMDLPIDLEETSLAMDVDDVTLQERPSGISTLMFENANTFIEIDFREVERTLISVKTEPTDTKLNLRTLQHVAGMALKNGIALHFDAVLLYQNASYGSALFLSVISMEEIGKAFWCDHYAWTSKVNNNRWDNENDWMNEVLSNHRSKQLAFIGQVPDLMYTPLLQQIQSKQLDAVKQNAIYVGLSKPKAGQPRTTGRLVSPTQTTKSQAKQQLKMVHDFLLDNIDGVRTGRLEHDLGVIQRAFSEELYSRLSALNL